MRHNLMLKPIPHHSQHYRLSEKTTDKILKLYVKIIHEIETVFDTALLI